MAYFDFDTDDHIIDNLQRKERFSLLKQKSVGEDSAIHWYQPRRLEFHVNQVIAAMVMNPTTSVRRLLIKYSVGNGKTLTAILVTLGFTRIYSSLPEVDVTSRIYFIGYTESIIKEEILAHPELGFMSHAERLELNSLAEASKSGNRAAGEQYVSLMNRVKSRIGNPKKGGYFKFFGYIQLATLLFGIKDIETVNVAQALKNGEITINQQLLEKFRGSVIVCDEVHEIYNTVELNNAGLAILHILDHFGDQVRAIFMSATPINNSPSEVIDLINLLQPKDQKLVKSDYFTSEARARLLPGKINEIGQFFEGKVLFLEESGDDYPELHYMGEPVPGIDLLPFIATEMSPLHANTYRTTQAFQKSTLESDEKTVLDMVFPNPEFSHAELIDPKTRAIGLFRTNEILNIMSNSSEKWRQDVGIQYVPAQANRIGYFTGKWLHRSRLGTYSSKYLKMIKLVRHLVKKDVGKFFIWHEKVKLGAVIIQQILLQNGFVDETGDPGPETLCTMCGATMAKHTEGKACEKFRPARIITIHGMVSPKQIERLVQEYSSNANRYGENFRGIIGSSKVRQSFNFRGTRFVIPASIPVNIPTFIQFNGRAYRRGSMKALRPKHRQMFVYTMLTLGGIEEVRYKNKIDDYKEIMKIEREINKRGLNNYINGLKFRKDSNPFSSLEFDSVYAPKTPGTDVSFRAYSYFEQEIAVITTTIKRLFLSIPVWKIEDLWDSVQKPPFKVDRRGELIDRGNFDIALKNLLHYQDVNMFRYSIADNSDVFRTFEETGNKIFTFEYRNGAKRTDTRKVLVNVGEYIVLTPFKSVPVLDVDSFLSRSYDSPYVKIPINIGRDRRNQSIFKTLATYKSPIKSLVEFPADFHQYAMRTHLENTNKLPAAFEKMYKALGILGDNFYNWQHKMILTRSGWIEQPREDDKRVENDFYIGFIDDQQFKIRRPKHVINRELDKSKLDLRKIERGVKCMSIKKEAVGTIAAGIKLKLDKGTSTKQFCQQALEQLFKLDTTDKDCRWLYIFNEEDKF